MRCSCCDADLTDIESSRKSRTTGEYLDMCNTCFEEVADVFIDIEEQEELETLEREINNDYI